MFEKYVLTDIPLRSKLDGRDPVTTAADDTTVVEDDRLNRVFESLGMLAAAEIDSMDRRSLDAVAISTPWRTPPRGSTMC